MKQLLLIVTALTAIACDLCKLQSCNCKKHINCEHPSETISSSCPAGAKLVDMNKEIQAEILNEHNTPRDVLASGNFNGFPAAVYMATMEWSTDLAQLARKNVLRCKLEFDGCRNTNEWHFVGQLLGRYEYPKIMNYKKINMIHEIIVLWFSEYKYATNLHIDEYPVTVERGRDIRHFGQISKDDATLVGCAGLEFIKNSTRTFIFCCNYNQRCVPGYSIYDKHGGPASKCVKGRNPAFSNLCNVGEPYHKVNDYNHLRKDERWEKVHPLLEGSKN